MSCFVLFTLIACSSAQEERPQIASDSTGLKTAPAESAEVVVETCSAMKDGELATLLDKYALQVKRRVSPIIVVVTWKDDRQPDAIIRELEGVQDFCTVQKNYRYQIMKK